MIEKNVSEQESSAGEQGSSLIPENTLTPEEIKKLVVEAIAKRKEESMRNQMASRMEELLSHPQMTKLMEDLIRRVTELEKRLGVSETEPEEDDVVHVEELEESLDSSEPEPKKEKVIGYEVELHESYEENCDFKVVVLDHERRFMILDLNDKPFEYVKPEHHSAITSKLKEMREYSKAKSGVRYFGKIMALSHHAELYEDYVDGCDFKIIVLDHELNFITLDLEDTPFEYIKPVHRSAIDSKLKEMQESGLAKSGVRYFGKVMAYRCRDLEAMDSGAEPEDFVEPVIEE